MRCWLLLLGGAVRWPLHAQLFTGQPAMLLCGWLPAHQPPLCAAPAFYLAADPLQGVWAAEALPRLRLCAAAAARAHVFQQPRQAGHADAWRRAQRRAAPARQHGAGMAGGRPHPAAGCAAAAAAPWHGGQPVWRAARQRAAATRTPLPGLAHAAWAAASGHGPAVPAA